MVEGMRGMIGVYPDVDPAARRFTGGASGIIWGHGGSASGRSVSGRWVVVSACLVVVTHRPMHLQHLLAQMRLWLHLILLMPAPVTVQRLQLQWHAEHGVWPFQSLPFHVHAAACRGHSGGTLGLEVRPADCEDAVCCLEQHHQHDQAA